MSRDDIFVTKECMYFPNLLCEILHTLVELIFFNAHANVYFIANGTAYSYKLLSLLFC